ncbi:small RNA 2'-O-methyltransferase [Bombina bombina]|uniref:small RNA 2'-O-methyltransferase n=1 Tax=Bombina bombina TaxID=8345 RepID=UPI00235B1F54|nr:small RNA 2'-O-methyltransferase [Bombina bombina]
MSNCRKEQMTSAFFQPPLYKQRYQFVRTYVDTYKPQKVADLGCGECSLLCSLKFWDCVELLVGLDIDEDVLRSKMNILSPLVTHYLEPRKRSLTVTLYKGSVTQKDPALLGFDLITCIELIEHLQEDDLEKLQDVIFGFLAPRSVVISTPNAEFNPLLPNLTSFRHPDHKFEWTREQFQSWATAVSQRYNYSVEFSGVGRPPAGSEDVGFCSQIGVFTRNYTESEDFINKKKECKSVYKTVYNVVYPSLVEEKYLRQAVLRSALSEAYTMKSTLLERLFPEEYEPEENFTETLKESGRTLLWPPKQNTISEPKEDKTIEPSYKETLYTSLLKNSSMCQK